jgi:hypothetical protein
MAYQSVGLGSSADDGGGDTLRSGGTKINANFLEIYNLLGDGSDLTSGLGISGSQVTLTTPIIAEIDSSSTITLDATTDIVLDADGGDIFFKDAGTTFGSANNNSGNLIVKSGTTTALTFSGANATVAGTLASGAITSSGVVTGSGFTVGSAVITEAELEQIDGITAGTAAASKALVLDSSTNISGIGTISSGAITSSGVVTATGFTIGSAVINEAELETIDGITGGTVIASKAVVVDANKDIGIIRNLTIDGTFSDGNYTFDTSGNVSGLGTIGSGAITSTGVVTATGFTIGSAVIIEAELETLDGITAGTAAGSKAVVLDANKDIGTLRNITLSGELDAGSLDVSGNADIDGTLEADAITVDGVTLAEYIADTTGAMVTSNTETGITVTYEDGDNTLDFALGAAQTTITSLLATDIKIGEDNDTKMDFETANEIHFYASAAEQVYVADGVFGPQTDSDVDLGTTGVRWKDAFIDTVTTTGAITSAGLVTAGSLNLGDDTVTTLKSGTYTPTWVAASGTAPAIGNGSLTGRYTQIGSLCHVLIKIYFGSSSTFGNGGVLRFGLPFTAATISGMAHVGSGSYIINDSGTGTTGGTVELGSALAYITLNCNPSGTVGATLATNAVPLTWANGDSLTVECLYEV